MRRRRLAIVAVIGATLAAVAAGGFGVLSASAAPEGKQTICHSTNSETNPYVVNTPNKNGDLDGHADHTGPIWQPGFKEQNITWGDIIPPFDFGDNQHFPGLNWTAEGQAIFNNGCVPPNLPPPSTETPTTAPPVTQAAPPPPPGPPVRVPAPVAAAPRVTG